jgi:SAM-dependent methyltransferase
MVERVGFIGGDPLADPSLLSSSGAMDEYYDRNYQPWLPLPRGSRVLDYGCGPGGLLRYLAARGYTDVTGFDVDTRYAAFCRTHTSARVIDAADGLAFLREEAERYDLVIARHVLYYFPRSALQEAVVALAGALAPGGTLVVEVFNGAGFAGSWPWVNDPYIQAVFSDYLLGSLLCRAGLRVESLRDEQLASGGGLRRRAWLAGRRVWAGTLRVVYTLERGLDERNPRFFGKNLIAIARRPR